MNCKNPRNRTLVKAHVEKHLARSQPQRQASSDMDTAGRELCRNHTVIHMLERGQLKQEHQRDLSTVFTPEFDSLLS